MADAASLPTAAGACALPPALGSDAPPSPRTPWLSPPGQLSAWPPPAYPRGPHEWCVPPPADAAAPVAWPRGPSAHAHALSAPPSAWRASLTT
uniref:Putative secreted protein n=1 Tax=Ixodes ricinus TaxID=34613 RepID=A0A6B0UD24_IXORI